MAKASISNYVNIIISMTFWAFSFVWVKEAYESFGPVTTIFFRLIISSFLLFVFLKLTNRLKPVKKEDYKLFISLAFFEPFLYFISESFGLKMVSSTLASVIISTIPIFTSVFAYFIYKERLTLISIFGIIFSFTGVGVMIFEGGFRLNAPLLGIALMFIAVLSTIGYSLVLKKLALKYPPVNIIAYQNLIGIFMFLPVFMAVEMKNLPSIQLKTNAVIAIIELAVFASTIAFITFTKSIKNLGVTKSNIFINLIPVLTAFFAWWILGDIITVQKATGITIVIAGLFISQIKKKKHAA
ncbi:DMT family transporter [Plebeiibacterium marinum]|uniref:DMT family transporter n=1 Tax=Plebeiibacterium marinum TaxID=2992111 RepID=A0AAE3SJ90_9BACT|nr:DMT family transporter [Plebeiobacterium marinum]MCW3805194.1 DMT family transporter [Plebeiobacterium marinum]